MRLLQIALLLLAYLCTFSSAYAERRAVVIGIKDYQNNGIPHLVNSLTDADLISQKLSSVGFNVSVLKNEDATAPKFATFWQGFKENTNPGDEVVIYFSGHGFSKDGSNFIALQDMPSPTSDMPFSKLRTKLINITDLSRELEELDVQIGVIILEACRENIFDPSTHAPIGSGGLVVKTENRGTVIWYAASNGEVAKDSDATDSVSKGSTFTRVIVDNFDQYKTTDIERFGKEMRKPVYDAAQPIAQHSEMASNIFFDWCFTSCGTTTQALSVKVFNADRPSLASYSAVSEEKLTNFIASQDLVSNNTIHVVPIDPKFANVRLYPKYSGNNQLQAATGIIAKLQESGIYAATPDQDDIGLCKKYSVPTVIYHADQEKDAAQASADLVTAAISAVENQSHITAATEQHPESTGKFTPFRFALCMSGLR
ncbi:caspase family protein [Rhizobium sp. CB3090]|uniref:caspase family protein n=1 Tax=Rhizobium sp. CB3090 TaxID=3039156 RepID=UPI0024B15E5B|nr:caspase family protein [Rhizobium sp. CB3090]WFU10899.1 caspase family protein [Rhizobium sp. CB3090]